MTKPKEKNIENRAVYIPCSINRASLGESETAYVILHDLLNSPNRPAWVSKKFVVIKPQTLNNGRLAAWVVAKEIGMNQKAYKVAIMNDGKYEILEVSKSSVINAEEAISLELNSMVEHQGNIFSEVLEWEKLSA